MTPLYSHRLIHASTCEADFEIDSRHANSVVIWEPLHVDAPAEARPHCCLFNTIQFTEGGRHDDKRPWQEVAYRLASPPVQPEREQAPGLQTLRDRTQTPCLQKTGGGAAGIRMMAHNCRRGAERSTEL